MSVFKRDSTESTPSEAKEASSISWQRWCRLCAKDDNASADDSNMNVSVYCKLEQGLLDTTLATAIGKYFWVNIREDDTIPKVVCAQCHKLVTSLVAFTERVNKVQALFYMLQNSKSADAEYAQELRAQYELLPDEWEHIIAVKKQPEEIGEMRIKIIEADMDTDAEEEDSEAVEVEGELEEETGVTEIQKLINEKYKQGFESVKDQPEELQNLSDGEENVEEMDETGETTLEEYIFADDDATELKRLKKEQVSEIDGENDDGNVDEGEGDENEDDDDEENHEDDVKFSALDDEVVDSDLFKELKYKVAPSGSAVYVTSVQYTPGKRGRPVKKPGEPTIKYAKRIKPSDADGAFDHFRYSCSVCSKGYKNASSYRKHMTERHEIVSDLPEFACGDCGRLFATERMRNVHERIHLPLSAKADIPCPYCEKKFTKVTIMRQHVNGIHHQAKPFICDECGRALKTLAALNEHKLVHTDECPYECEVCHARFKNRPRLKIHMDTHSENPYVCTECGKKLNTRRTLKMHMLVHTEEKTLKCDFCSASFKRAKALKNHLILHTGLRPYKCNFCDKTFSNGSNCRSHKKKLHQLELEQEEAQGIKSDPIITPKLDELRASTVVIDTPRQVKRHTGGLPPAMRALLLAAEERAKNADAKAAVKCDEIEYSIRGLNEDEGDDEEEEFVYEIIDEI